MEGAKIRWVPGKEGRPGPNGGHVATQTQGLTPEGEHLFTIALNEAKKGGKGLSFDLHYSNTDGSLGELIKTSRNDSELKAHGTDLFRAGHTAPAPARMGM